MGRGRVSMSKTFAQFLRKKVKNFAYFSREKLALCVIIRKLHWAKNCAILLLRNSVLRNFKEHILIKRLIKGVNCIHYISMRLHFLAYNCNA